MDTANDGCGSTGVSKLACIDFLSPKKKTHRASVSTSGFAKFCFNSAGTFTINLPKLKDDQKLS